MNISIQLLPDDLVSQIAAGEVIERPASALKELLENSLDAKADQIHVELEEGGLKKLRVKDNGMGIPYGQLKMAFERHATSKLQAFEDLLSLRSFGFRGEALASIASISKVVAMSRHFEDRLGQHLELSGGKMELLEDSSCEAGTDISIYGLFQHTPARKKYMKSFQTEVQHCLELLFRTALIHPQVGFTVLKDGEMVVELPKNQRLEERILSLYGKDTLKALIPVQFLQANLQIKGFVGKPELSRHSKKYQFLYINDRPIQNRLIHQAVVDAFHSLLMNEKHPWYFLDIQIDPAQVDVNVHPRKLEVRFVNSQEVFRAVRGAVLHGLESQNLSPQFGELREAVSEFDSGGMQMDFSLSERSETEWTQREVFEVKGSRLRPLAQLHRSYILAENPEGLVVIDQHAAHERVRYERLLKEMEENRVPMQALLSPLELDFGVAEKNLIATHLEVFKELGFELEPFGGNSFLLRSVPSDLGRRKPDKVIQEILGDLGKEMQPNHVKSLREKLVVSAACRGAVMFGDELTMVEMEALLRDMENTLHPTHCPHGRPSMLRFDFAELETLFKRRNF